MSDAAILALFSARDEQAIEETAKKYGGICFSVANSILLSAEDAEECVSDMLLTLWNSLPEAGLRSEQLSAYILSCVRRLALNRYRTVTALKRRGSVSRALEELESVLPDREDVQSRMNERVLLEAIQRFLADQPADYRRIFLQRFWYFRTAREIADDLNLKESSVRAVLTRLRQKLRTYLEKEEIYP
ncbi:MAG: sigma-70 family RNA polymerase sigma factor [Oscillospiraceae bacterium]|nr:sigma-70 family RNA polymerase sigma factor [Oscillospiraceae bacterium]